MKLQIDTTNKTVKFETALRFSELEDTLKKLLPEDYKDYSIEVNTTINWTYPQIIYRDYPYWRPWSLTSGNTYNALSQGLTTTSNTVLYSGDMTVDYGNTEMAPLKSEGVYNIEL